VLASEEVKALLSGEVVIEEKIDGANLGISLGSNGELRAQNRGQYLAHPSSGQFARLAAWEEQHSEAIRSALGFDLMIFGEWAAARHSLAYDALPDWFLMFDVYDRRVKKFWSTLRRDELARKMKLSVVPVLSRRKVSFEELMAMVSVECSRYSPALREGLIVRRESKDWCDFRAKLVRPQFIQQIDEHWRHRRIEWNRLATTRSR
jgi:ATP-dependent RNA circularization protein (DNA/RNA ligase family)